MFPRPWRLSIQRRTLAQSGLPFASRGKEAVWKALASSPVTGSVRLNESCGCHNGCVAARSFRNFMDASVLPDSALGAGSTESSFGTPLALKALGAAPTALLSLDVLTLAPWCS